MGSNQSSVAVPPGDKVIKSLTSQECLSPALFQSVEEGDKFQVPQQEEPWTRANPITVSGLGASFTVQASPSCTDKEDNRTTGSSRRLLVHNGEPIAVLVADDYRKIQVCAFRPPPGTKEAKLCGTEGDRPLFEWAVVAKHLEKGSVTNRFACTTSGTNKRQLVYVTQRNRSTKKISVTTATDAVCAILEDNNEWHCRTSPVIDPAMLVAFVVGVDHWKVQTEALIRANSRDVILSKSNVLRNV